MNPQATTVQNSIEQKLAAAFHLQHLSVQNESHNHNVPKGSESHFKVTLVSEVFANVRPVQRHQKVYAVLSEELAGSVHALAIHAYTPEEWQARFGEVPMSPPCMGGSLHDR